jgi:hypothetical protein
MERYDGDSFFNNCDVITAVSCYEFLWPICNFDGFHSRCGRTLALSLTL